MKNQYVGDIGDYGKYWLLRFLAARGIKIGVNWYLTPDDGTTDGKFVDYLNSTGESEPDAELIEVLDRIVNDSKHRSVFEIEKADLIPSAIYYNVVMPIADRPTDRVELRCQWFEDSLSVLGQSELIFCDPDVGMLPESRSVRRKGSEAYVLPKEVAAYYGQGSNVVYYCQRARRGHDAWEKTKLQMIECLPDAKLMCLTYHKGTQRSYLFVLHPDDYGRYCQMLTAFERSAWNGYFTLDYVGGRLPGRERVGEAFEFETRDGEVITIARNANGEICLRSSRDRTTSQILTPDGFARRLFMRW